jgi:acetate kinase
MRVLTVNAGSSSVKLRVVDSDDRLAGSFELEAPEGRVHDDELADALDGLGSADAVGHRFVHGGDRFRSSVRLDERVLTQLLAYADLAPLHQPAAIDAAKVVSRLRPTVPAVGCFDTAFHTTIPPAAATYAVPDDWRIRLGVRRYGFHGLSHAWASRRAAQLIGLPMAELRVVSCHLGAGASLAAVHGGRSIDTTMGFTPLEGLVMATRSGSIDPGIVSWLVQRQGVDPDEVDAALFYRSGLLGLTGTSDMREVLTRAHRADARAQLGLDVYVHRLRREIAAMAAALGGLDVLVFTGGVGEHSPEVRVRAVEGLRFLGIEVDRKANDDAASDADVSAPAARVRTVVVEAREDLEMAREVRDVLGGVPRSRTC